jgi:hypothetical protein
MRLVREGEQTSLELADPPEQVQPG